MQIQYIFPLCLLLGLATPRVGAERYLKGDFHQHTTYTDGSYSFGYVMAQNNRFGLDWWANSEHGGTSLYNGSVSGKEPGNGTLQYWDEIQPPVIKGVEKMDEAHRLMWRWQVLQDSSFAQVCKARKTYPDKTILQSFEFNIPGHEHGSLGIIDGQTGAVPNCDALARFEYMFDQNDQDTLGGAAQGWTKSTLTGHAKALEALRWLRQNHPATSYLVIAHPERYPQNTRGYSIAALRDMNNEAPDICFGFESIPGHHRETTRPRGLYERTSVGGGTYGGTGIYAAKIGGMWDALLSEGRRFWLFANSDFHSEVGDFYPGEYLTNYTCTQGTSPQQIVDGLRSGNTWVVMGNLIDSLIFTAASSSSGKKITMGQTLTVAAGEKVVLTIRVRDPKTSNFNRYSSYTNPSLDHLDLIQGVVTGKVDPADPSYNTDSVPTTRVVARFDARGGQKDGNGLISTRWKKAKGGWLELTYELKNADKAQYFRLRGTNHPLSTPNETDHCGNPLSDVLMEPNSAAKAFADLWFYSNPLYINSNIK